MSIIFRTLNVDLTDSSFTNLQLDRPNLKVMNMIQAVIYLINLISITFDSALLYFNSDLNNTAAIAIVVYEDIKHDLMFSIKAAENISIKYILPKLLVEIKQFKASLSGSFIDDYNDKFKGLLLATAFAAAWSS